MEQLIEGLSDDVGRAGLAWVALAAFLFAFAETALFTDLLVPGEVGMILVGRRMRRRAGRRANARAR